MLTDKDIMEVIDYLMNAKVDDDGNLLWMVNKPSEPTT